MHPISDDINQVPLPPFTPPPGNLPSALERYDLDNLMLNHLLKLADRYRISGSLHQAIEIYFELLQSYPESIEAGCSMRNLTEIAGLYERTGEFHQARSLYERLLKRDES